VFSEGCISASHGTGAIFLRNFSRYPADRLCNAFIGSAQDPGLAATIDLNAARWPATGSERLAALPVRLWNLAARRGWRQRAVPASRHAIARALRAAPFEPELLYAICYGAEGLATLHAIAAALPDCTPVLVHFHDFWPRTNASFAPLLRRLGPRIAAVWTVSRPIARFVGETTGLACLVDPGFHLELPETYKTSHRDPGRDFQVVVLGNIWSRDLLLDLKALWRWCRARRPELGPIEWYCHPQGVLEFRAAGQTPEPELSEMGFLRGRDLSAMLAGADLALIPFSRETQPATDYERYSMPSRVTELAAAGVPMFGLTSPLTPLAGYLTEKDIGRHAPSAHTEMAGRALLALIDDRTLRETLGSQARALAEAEFPLQAFQSSLYSRLAALAQPIEGRS
jgi:glycosyltransferase involved in cell wall biosynthesis